MADVIGKLLPRNLAGLRAGIEPVAAVGRVAGNPASTLLQSGVGNCYPGLEFDIRNLERRFFPFLEVDTNFAELHVAAVDLPGAQAAATAGQMNPASLAAYQAISASAGWQITRLAGDFGPLGQLDVVISALSRSSMGPDRSPPDAWSAVRLLREGAVVAMTLSNGAGPDIQLQGARMRYLDPNGALSEIFEVGELSQSLCSPWTHDFRDCGCYYWASNHPDIALPPPVPSGAPPQPADNLATPWLRDIRTAQPPATGTGGATEIPHNAINRSWQQLGIVLERRERVSPYAEEALVATPLPNEASLITHLRFAAGVELALALEYLVAAWSLKLSAGQAEPLRGDLRAAFFEVQHVAIGEMRHLRSVNETLRSLQGAAYLPALQVAAQVPQKAGQWRAVSFQALMPDVMAAFVEVEAPSQSVDSLYAPILATLEVMPNADDAAQAVRTIMAEGSDHWQTFQAVQEWLGRHPPAAYLRALAPATAALPAHQILQTRYVSLLEKLHSGYAKGLPLGAGDVNDARTAMLGGAGIEEALEAVASTGAIPQFDAIADPRFTALQPPP